MSDIVDIVLVMARTPAREGSVKFTPHSTNITQTLHVCHICIYVRVASEVNA